MKKITLTGCVLLLCTGLLAQVHVRTFSEQICTLTAGRSILELTGVNIDGSDDDNTLHIGFDEMSHNVHFYTYTVRHMTADWSRESDLLSNEYVQGFTTQDITDYEHSINTNREYTHYWFDFPNENMVLTKSGNYRLFIYEDGNPDKRVGEVDFCVVEPLTKISGKVRTDTDIEFNGRFQQVDFDVATTALDLRDPNEISVFVEQNNRLDNVVRLTQPTFVEPNRLRYQNKKELIFEGGNEYHHFDAMSVYYAGAGIDRMTYENGDYHALLFADEMAAGQYIHEYDNDGAYVVNAEHKEDSNIEAEYVWAHWTLPIDKPWLDGAVYVNGDIFDNELSLRNRMQYDAQNKCYWLTALVKQGGYNYQYLFVGKGAAMFYPKNYLGQNQTTTQRVDGSYWQTENQYVVYVYWRPFGARYDRLVGVKAVR